MASTTMFKFPIVMAASSLALGVPVVVQRKRIWLGMMRLWVLSMASISGLRIPSCPELWRRLQTRGSDPALLWLVYASSCSSDLIPSLGISECHRCGPKKRQKKKKMFVIFSGTDSSNTLDSKDNRWRRSFEKNIAGQLRSLVWHELDP